MNASRDRLFELLAAAAATTGMFACSAPTPSEGPIDKAESALLHCGTELGSAPLHSTCGHGWAGPFGDLDGTGSAANPIVADANVAVPGDVPRFSEPRVLYTVSLPGTPGSNQAAVKFTPAVTQDYTLAVSGPTPVMLLNPSSVPVQAVLGQDVTDECSAIGAELPSPQGVGLTALAVFPLTAGVTYRVVLGPSSESSLGVLIDEPNDFLNAYYSDADHDSFGAFYNPFLSECTPPAGFVADNRDCDDTNPAIHPGAPEVADGVDNNCDGFVDVGGSYDLRVLDVNPIAPPTQLLVGESATVVVEQLIENQGPGAVDAQLARTASTAGPGSISPANDSEAVAALGSFERRTLSTEYSITCSGDGTATFTVAADIEATTPGVTDPDPRNNVASASFTVRCVLLWPEFGRNSEHSRRSPLIGSQTDDVFWTYRARRAVRSSPAVGQDGSVYVGSDDHQVHALDAEGALRWTFQTRDDVSSSPAVTLSGVVYVGSDDRRLYALTTEGALVWSLTTGGAVRSSPVVGTDGAIYVGSDDHKLYAVEPSGTVRWRVHTWGDVRSSPALAADGTVYVGSDDHRLYAVNANGTVKWAYRTGGSVRSSPAVAPDGTIYVGSDDSRLYALRPDGTKKWAFRTRGEVRSSPAIAEDGTIYVGSDDEHLYAVHSDGTFAWRFDVKHPVRSSPAVGADGTLYFGAGKDCESHGHSRHSGWGSHRSSFEDKDDCDCDAHHDDPHRDHHGDSGRSDHRGRGSRDRDHGHVFAVTPDGQSKWTAFTFDAVVSSPAIGLEGAVLVGGNDAIVRSFGREMQVLAVDLDETQSAGSQPVSGDSTGCAVPVVPAGQRTAPAGLLSLWALIALARRRRSRAG